MRSILALALALLILVAEAPGVFTESPVCAALEGRGSATGPARAPAKSCCGTASCPMHATGCGTAAACPMPAAKANPAVGTAKARTGAGASSFQICAPSCGREGARVAPGVPDPGTFDPPRSPATPLTSARLIEFVPGNLPTRNPAPLDPPPRA